MPHSFVSWRKDFLLVFLGVLELYFN